MWVMGWEEEGDDGGMYIASCRVLCWVLLKGVVDCCGCGLMRDDGSRRTVEWCTLA